MTPKRFVGFNSSDALRQVKEALGSDAVVLSTRTVAGEVEMVAMKSDDMDSITQDSYSRPQKRVMSEAAKPADMGGSAEATPASFETHSAMSGHAKMTQPSAFEGAGMNNASMLGMLMNELHAMRSMLESQMADMTWNDMQRRRPAKAAMVRVLLQSGFSALTIRQLLEDIPQDLPQERALSWLRQQIEIRLLLQEHDSAWIEQGGVIALVGPTGVGKTTTTAKLAARCLVHHGAASIALLTTDTYRIAAHEQLRVYGDILGVPVWSIRNSADLRTRLGDMAGRKLALVDTVGMGQRDQGVSDLLHMLHSCGRPVKRVLVLSASSSRESLDEVIRAYQPDGVAPLEGVIFSKLDEAVQIGHALDVVMRHKLKLFYVTNGQRVPEDFHLPNRGYLLQRALSVVNEDSPYWLDNSQAAQLWAMQGAQATANRGVFNGPM